MAGAEARVKLLDVLEDLDDHAGRVSTGTVSQIIPERETLMKFFSRRRR
jgi:hypothetical protein